MMENEFEEDFFKWLRSESREEKEKRLEKEQRNKERKWNRWKTLIEVWAALVATIAVLYSILKDKGII